MHTIVFSIRKINIFLLRISGECDVPNRTGAERPLVEEFLLQKLSFGSEYLNAIIGPITNVQQAIDREFCAMYRIAELLRGHCIRIVWAEILVAWLIPIRAPVAFVLSCLGVVDDHAVVAVAIGDVRFVFFFVDEDFSRSS